jgi:hypothetical protein
MRIDNTSITAYGRYDIQLSYSYFSAISSVVRLTFIVSSTCDNVIRGGDGEDEVDINKGRKG